MNMRKLGFAALFAMGLSGCQTDQAATSIPPPDYRAVILANKGLLWKDPDSIKAASIAAPRRHAAVGLIPPMWHVCVRANAKNAFGGYTGEKDMLVGMYDDGQPPKVIMADATGYCDYPHEPFPELEGGYKAPPAKPARA